LNPNPVYHQVVFAILVLLTSYRLTYLIRWSPMYRSRTPPAVKDECLRLFWSGGLLFIFAFVIWNLDNVFCDTLTVWKHALGWPAAVFLEGLY
jgi:dihydroceramidase